MPVKGLTVRRFIAHDSIVVLLSDESKTFLMARKSPPKRVHSPRDAMRCLALLQCIMGVTDELREVTPLHMLYGPHDVEVTRKPIPKWHMRPGVNSTEINGPPSSITVLGMMRILCRVNLSDRLEIIKCSGETRTTASPVKRCLAAVRKNS